MAFEAQSVAAAIAEIDTSLMMVFLSYPNVLGSLMPLCSSSCFHVKSKSDCAFRVRVRSMGFYEERKKMDILESVGSLSCWKLCS